MKEKINNRTPEEIKKGLECCAEDGNCSKGCPYNPIRDCGNDLYSDALAYIQRLEAAQPKWISVEERLPEIGRTVICCAKGYIPLIGTGWYDANLNMWHLDFVGKRTVTHWMPLPSCPEEVK